MSGLEHLRSCATQILDRCVNREEICFLADYPNHPNPGDALLWLAAYNYLRRRGGALIGTCLPSARLGLLPKLSQNVRIVLPGGGNFGDLWPRHHKLRLHIIKAFPQNPILQLPQSVCFKDERCLKQTQAIVNSHPRLILLARDEKSAVFMRRHFSVPVELCPDMAYLESHTPALTGKNKLLLMPRDDQEKAAPYSSKIPDARVCRTGWLARWQEVPAFLHAMLRVYASSSWFSDSRDQPAAMTELVEILHGRVSRTIEFLADAQVVVSDRLHVNIMCDLIGVPHVAVENSYGKIGAFAQSWGLQKWQTSSSWEEAIQLACLSRPLVN